MAYVYILRGTMGRYYIGATEDVGKRLIRHNSGMVHSTKRLGLPLQLIAIQAFPSMDQAFEVERQYKRWKNPSKVIRSMTSALSSPDESGLVVGSNPTGPTKLNL